MWRLKRKINDWSGVKGRGEQWGMKVGRYIKGEAKGGTQERTLKEKQER